MTDADVDGSHIKPIINFFNNQPFNELIEKDIFMTPPFQINKGGKSTYIKNEKDLEKHIISLSENGSKKLKKTNLQTILVNKRKI